MQLFQKGRQTGIVQIIRHYFRARRQAGLHPRLGFETFLHGFFGQQACRNHDRRIRSVGATGNRRDHDRPILNGLAVVVHGERRAARRLTQRAHKILLHVRQIDAILWALGTSQGRNHFAQVEAQSVAVIRVGRSGGEKQTLLLGVSLHECDQGRRAVGEPQILQRLFIDGKKANGRTIFRRHVGDGGSIGQAQRSHAGSIKFHELTHHAFFAQSLRHRQNKIGGRATFRQAPRQFKPNHFGQQHGNWLAQHAGFGLNAAHAPAHHAQPVDHGGVRIRAHQRIRIRQHRRLLVIREHDGRQVFQIDLMHDACIRRNHTEILKRGLSPA